tara:strand:- start:23292 stop:26918 length:3627 start_codon:yes stop_codon:yes gene_type:complete
MKFFIIIFLFCFCHSFSQTIESDFVNYCSDDTVELTLDYNDQYNFLQWQSFQNDSWVSISENASYQGVSSENLIISNVDQSFDDLLFRVILDTGIVVANTLFSSTFSFNIYDEFVIGTLVGNQTICFEDIPSLLSAPSASGGEGTYAYQWFKDGDIISGANSVDYQSSSLSSNSSFSVQIADNCGVENSNEISVSVYNELIPGSIAGSETICFNTIPSGLFTSINPSGGQGDYDLQWQESSNGINWVDIDLETSSTYIPSNLTSNTSYRLQITDSCNVMFTNVVEITVYDEFVISSLIGDQTICFNSTSSTLSAPTASGGEGTYAYQWFKNSSPLSGATSSNFNSTLLTENTNYSVGISDQCNSIVSNEISVTLYDQLIAGSIVGDTSICFNSSPGIIYMDSPQIGGGDNLSYVLLWQSSTDDVNWIDMDGESANTLATGSLTSSVFYRLKITTPSPFNCGPVFTNSVFVEVYNNFNEGILANQSPICFNSIPNAISFLSSPSGSDGNYSYQWQQSIDGSDWDTLIDEISDSFNPSTLTESIFYRVDVSSDYGCGNSLTNSVEVIVFDEFITGSLDLLTDTLCYNTNSQLINSNVMPSGGSSPYTYQWEQSVNNIDWSTIFNANSSSCNLENIINTTYLRVKYISSSGCGELYSSNTSQLVVLPLVDPGTILSDQILCYDSLASQLTVDELASGGNNEFIYNWQESVLGIWNDISEANSTSYFAGNMSSTANYRLSVTSSYKENCFSRFSDEVELFVFDSLYAGVISSEQQICFNTIPEEITLITPSSGVDGDYSFQWQSKLQSNEWSDIVGEVTDSFQPPALTETTFYRLQVKSEFGCGSSFTNSVEINVYDQFVASEIAGNDTICFLQDPNLIETVVEVSGANGVFSYLWQQNDSGVWFDINEANTTSYQPAGLSQNTSYRLVASNEFCQLSVNSNEINIVVNSLPITSPIIGDMIVCANQTLAAYSVETILLQNRYEWFTNDGDIIGSNVKRNLLIDWPSNSGSIAGLDVLVTNIETGCQISTSSSIEITDNFAPEIAEVILKPNSSILICSDSTSNLQFQWGYDIINTSESVILVADTLQYVNLDLSPDTNTFRHWVDISFSYPNNESCSTRCYYTQPPLPISSINEFDVNSFILYPNPVSSFLNYKFDNLINLEIKVIDLMGRIIECDINYNTNTILLNHKAGVYMLVVKSEKNEFIKKFIIQ